MKCQIKPIFAFLIFFQFSVVFADNKEPIFHYIDFLSDSKVLIPFDDIKSAQENDSSENKNNSECNTFFDALGMCSVKTTEGIHVSFKGIDFKSYATSTNSKFIDLYNAYDSGTFLDCLNVLYPNKDAINSGLSFSFKDFFLEGPPLTVKLGEISFSRSVSLLKNPQFNSMNNALKTSFGRLSGISPTLPSSSSSDKVKSVAVSFLSAPLSVEYACFEDSSFLFSVGTSMLYKNLFKANFAISGGRFYLSESNDSSWFCTRRRFVANWYDAGVFEVSLSIPRIKNNFSLGIHKNPFGNERFWLKNENRIIFGAFLIDSAFFSSDNFLFIENQEGIITADNSILTDIAQAKLNPQYLFKINNIQIRTGISTAINIQQMNLLPIEKYSKFQDGFGIELTTKKISAETTLKIDTLKKIENDKEENSEQKFSFTIQGSYGFSNWKASSKVALSQTINDSSTVKGATYSFNAYFPKRIVSNLSLKFSQNKNKTSESQTLESAVTLMHKTGKIRFKGKLAIECSF